MKMPFYSIELRRATGVCAFDVLSRCHMELAPFAHIDSFGCYERDTHALHTHTT